MNPAAYENGASLMSLNSQKVGSKFTLERVLEPDEPPLLSKTQHNAGRRRYLMLALTVLCFTAVRSNDLTFTFSAICMVGPEKNGSLNEMKSLLDGPKIPFSSQDLSMSFSGAGAGAIMAAMPLAWMLHRIGGRMVMGILLLMSSVATFVMPWAAFYAAQWGLPISTLVFPLRLFQGIGVAAVMPTLGFFNGQWAPIDEIGLFTTMLSSASQLSLILTMPFAGHMCVTAGWPFAFYAQGLFSIVISCCFLCFFTNNPAKCTRLGDAELNKITDGRIKTKRKDQRVPYRAIARSKPIWAIWIAFVGNSFGFQLILQFMPTYLNKVLGVPIEKTGFSSMIPPTSQLVFKLLAGTLCDKITFLSERRKLQVFNSIAMCGCGLFMVPLGYLHPNQNMLALGCLTASLSCLGLVSSGSIKNVNMVSRQYGHFVMAIVQFVACFGMLLIPFVVSTLAPNNTIIWRQCGQITLAARRRNSGLTLMYNIFFREINIPFSEIFTTSNRAHVSRNHRASLLVPRIRSDLLKHSFMVRYISLWNGLNNDIIFSPSAKSFSRKLLNSLDNYIFSE